jgi:hypothetical protein
MRLLALILLLILPAAPVQSQTVEQVRSMAAWALEISDYSEQTISLFMQADEADLISSQYLEGEITQAEALQQLDGLAADIDAALRASRSRALSLSQSPSGLHPRFERMMVHMEPLPLTLHNSVAEFMSISLDYFRNEINGSDTDYERYYMARFQVLGAYAHSIGQVNSASAESVSSENPNHFYLKSMGANFRMTALVFELARRRLGGEPARGTPRDIPAAFAEELALVRENTALGRNALTTMLVNLTAQVDNSQGLERSRWELLVEVMESLPEAFDNEEVAYQLFENYDQRVQPAQDWDAFDAYVLELADYEERRDSLMLERQRMIASMQ